MINPLNDYIGVILVLLVISIIQYLAFRHLKCLNKFQLVFVCLISSPILVVQGLGVLVTLLCTLMYYLVLMLGGIDVEEFNKEVKATEVESNNDQDEGDR